jgi:hypothetical protein
MNISQQSHAQTGKTETKVSESTKQNKLQPISNKNEGWSGVHHQLYQQQDRMNEWILLDNESTITIFCNPNMVRNIRETNKEYLDLVTNAGVLRTTQKATIPGWRRAWFNPHAITNIFSYAEMAKQHRITYDSNTEDASLGESTPAIQAES